jgi:hypothetical protein
MDLAARAALLGHRPDRVAAEPASAPSPSPGPAKPILQEKGKPIPEEGEPQGAMGFLRRLATSPHDLQLVRLNLRNDGTISGVSAWPDRGPSNVRGQGQHLTAYVSFEDMILSHVRDRTPEQAAEALVALLKDFYVLPGMKAPQAKYLRDGVENAAQRLRDAKGDAKEIGAVADEILRIRNQVPGTAVTGEGGGHGEAKDSGRLEVIETALRKDAWNPAWDKKVAVGESQFSMWRLLDYDPPPGADLGEIAKRVGTHFLSMRMSYPQVFAWLSAKQETWLFTYLKANRKGAGIPLGRLADATIDALQPLVHGML